jgi:hypothetical protein
MPLTVNAKTFTADKIGPDSVGYIGPDHTQSALDDIQLTRTVPKPTTVFSGVGRTTAKLTRTETLTGALTPTGNGIVAISCSIPVGFASADIDSMLNDMGSYLSSADFKLLVKNQKINF